MNEFKIKVVQSMTPDQLKIIEDLKQLDLINKESEDIMNKMQNTGLLCQINKEYHFQPIAILGWILKNGYIPK